MDKPNMPLKRPRKHSDFHKRNTISNNFTAKVQRQKRYQKEDLSWLAFIFKAFEKISNWFGGWFAPQQTAVPSHKKPEKRYPLWFRNRIARNRRRNQIAKESRRVNR